MQSDELQNAIEVAKQSNAFCNYLNIRRHILYMLDEVEQRHNLPSEYWKEEAAGFDYMLDASPLIIQNLREHCYHLTGVHSYEYRYHHTHDGPKQNAFAKKLEILRRMDAEDVFVSESPALGGFGYTIDGVRVNLDTLRFYESLIALSKSGALEMFRKENDERKVVLEIGAGWGGFAYQFKTLFPNVTYIIVDLPQTLLFSAVYLTTVFSSASIFTYDPRVGAVPQTDLLSYDFVFLPHYVLDDIQLDRLDLTVNMASFQEMTSEQVGQYIQKVHSLKCPLIYSLNRDRSRYNIQLSTVSSIAHAFYDLREIKVLDAAYDSVEVVSTQHRSRIRRAITWVLDIILRRRQLPQRSVHDHVHMIGTYRN